MVCYTKQDAEKSLSGFEKFTAPALKFALNAKIILPTERHDSDLATALDQCAGIDGIIVNAAHWAFSYSSRVQFGKNFETFTIRRSRPSGATTEADKLFHAWRIQAPMPTYHVQTFISENEQSAVVAVAPTVDLLKFVGKHSDQWRATRDGETFYFIPFNDLENVKIYHVDATGHVEKKNAA